MTVGILVLGQQLGLVEPTAQTSARALAAGALVAAMMDGLRIVVTRLRARNDVRGARLLTDIMGG